MNYGLEIDRAIDNEQLASASTLAEQWVVADAENGGAWSKLAHVHEMNDDFAKARDAVSMAIKISPNFPPYLFKQGYLNYRLANYADAANSFGRCVARSAITADGYYLDAAKIAQARCLVLDGSAHFAADVIATAAVSSATWLDQRYTKEDVVTSIDHAARRK